MEELDGNLGIRCLGDNESDNSSSNKQAKANTCACWGRNSVGNRNTENHSTKEASVEADPSGKTDLAHDISPSVECS